MTLTTRFNINDKVFYMENNKVASSTVRHISINVRETTFNYGSKIDTTIKYHIDGSNLSKCMMESTVFGSKEELLASL